MAKKPFILPKLYTPGYSETEKPTCDIVIDEDNVLRQKQTDDGTITYRSAIIPLHNTDIAYGKKLDFKPSINTAIFSDNGLLFPSDNANAILSYGDNNNRIRLTPVNHEQTLIVTLKFNGYGGGGYGRVFGQETVSDTNLEFTLYFKTTSPYLVLQKYFDFNISYNFNNFIPEVGKTYSFVFRKDSSNNYYCAVYGKGVLLDSVSFIDNSNVSLKDIGFGNRPVTYGRNLDGVIYQIFNDHRALSNDELLRYSEKPYQLLKPAIPNIVYLNTATGGANTYNYTSTGGITTGGSASVSTEKDFTGSGGITTGGSATTELVSASTNIYNYTSTGGIVTGGSADVSQLKNVVSSGGFTTGGSADTALVSAGTNIYNYTSTGGFTTGGSAEIIQLHNFLSTGGVLIGGSAVVSTNIISNITVTQSKTFMLRTKEKNINLR